MDGALCHDVDALAVLRFARAFHDAFYLTELSADLLHNAACSLTHGLHQKRTEVVREQAADEQTGDNHGIREVKEYFCVKRTRIFRKKHQSGKTCRPDGITLCHCLGRVADSIEGVGDIAY